uniref:Uncharacterized protein n=1 Tax=Rhizophora mucronata TaxID=61149 RepID=A0A2P2IJZ9_RHIMU
MQSFTAFLLVQPDFLWTLPYKTKKEL